MLRFYFKLAAGIVGTVFVCYALINGFDEMRLLAGTAAIFVATYKG